MLTNLRKNYVNKFNNKIQRFKKCIFQRPNFLKKGFQLLRIDYDPQANNQIILPFEQPGIHDQMWQ